MSLKSHIIAGAVGAIAFYSIFGPFKTLIFFLASFLIDVDHYLDYLWRTKGKDWSPKRMFQYYDYVIENKYDKNNIGFSIMHTVEVFFIIYLLSLYVSSELFLPILCGMAYHMIFDMVWLSYHKVTFIRPFSIVEYIIRKRKMIKDGLDPDGFYKKAFEVSKLEK